MRTKRILYFAIISFLLLISTSNIYSQVGANVVGSNSAQAKSITLSTEIYIIVLLPLLVQPLLQALM